MDPRAITKARSRLRVAANAVQELLSLPIIDAERFMDPWYQFLTAAKNVYTVLEQGAKDSPQSRQWFGGKKQERRDDELLQYVYQARNDDEHGLASIAEAAGNRTDLGNPLPGQSNEIEIYYQPGSIGQHGLVRYRSLDGKPLPEIKFTQPHIRLLAVHDRSGKAYPPPTQHLGRAIDNASPAAIAALMVSYLESLIEEAERLA